MSTTSQHPDVVIVGAGPVGLVAAYELAHRGIRIRIITSWPSRLTSRGPLPSTPAAWTRSIEWAFSTTSSPPA
jgi:2-polyprenyl-6-methoxyphenol hydroxylase-like FAD-dependent oxidoreductase